MLQFLSHSEQTRFSDLQAKLAQLVITDAEQQELAALVAKAQRSASERTKAVDSVKQLIADNGITIDALFSADEIAKAAAAQEPGKKTRGRKPGKAAKAERSNASSGQVLIQVKLDKSAGAPSRYKKGQKLGKFVSKNFKTLDAGGQLIDNLLKYATPQGQAYFATAEGRSELESFAAYIHQTPVNA